MRKIILLVLCSACAHETTTMDRELALKLADRPITVVQSAPPVVNLNFNGGSSAERPTCYQIPIYSLSGEVLKNETICR